MIIKNNIMTSMTSRQLGLHNSEKLKHTERLSTGYKINRAADNTAGLAISEKMREQIRGLERATKNAEDGRSFIQTADGAINEITNMMHRMKELAVASCSDTYTDQDRAALQAEFDQLQSEMDHIFTETEFNTIPVFEEHDPSYYCVEGNVYWDQGQLHNINSGDNDFCVMISNTPNDDVYEIKVPPGLYTTQELIDEIEDAFAEQYPAQPGFVVEFTKDGLCNFLYEGGENVKSVGGSLSYLINDNYKGGGIGSLIGTTQFVGNWPLAISANNNQMEFFLEDLVGNSSKVSITIPTGNYTKQQLIDYLNSQLGNTGVTAQEYGDKCIQIAGNDHMVTGLKGNMFEIDGGLYTSVFYDNTKYGSTSDTKGYIVGRAYYTTDANDKDNSYIKINGTNDTLTIRVNGDGADPYTTIQIPHRDYTVKEMVDFLNSEFTTNGLNAAAELRVERRDGIWFEHLAIVSKTTGDASKVEVDKANSTSYNDLFCETEYIKEYYINPYTGYNNVTEPYLTGSKVLQAPITIPPGKNELKLNVDGITYTLTLQEKTYATTNDLITEINNQINNGAMGIKGNIVARMSSGRIQFTTVGTNTGIQSIKFAADKGSAYEDLFRGVSTQTNTVSKTNYGTAGSVPKISLDHVIDNPVIIDSTNNTFQVYADDRYKTVRFPDGTYSPQDLIDIMNEQLKPWNQPSLNNVNINVTGTQKGVEGSTIPVDMQPAEAVFPNTLTESIFVDGRNNSFSIEVDGQMKTVTLSNGTYTRAQMIAELNKQFTANGVGVKASLKNNKLCLTTVSKGNNATLKVNSAFSGSAMSALSNSYAGMTASLNGGKLALEGVETGSNRVISLTTSSGGSSMPVFVGTKQVIQEAYDTPKQSSQAASYIDGANISAPVTIDDSNREVKFTYNHNGTNYSVNFQLAKKAYTFSELQQELQNQINTAVGGSGKLNVTVNSAGVVIRANNVGNNYSFSGFTGGFHKYVISGSKYNYSKLDPTIYNGKQVIDSAYIIGRNDVKNKITKIEKDKNDRLVLDFTVPDGNGGTKVVTLDFKLDKGEYTGSQLVKQIQSKLNEKLVENGMKANFIEVGIGGLNSGVVGSNDANSLNFQLSKSLGNIEPGNYKIDGIRGSAAFHVFYKSQGDPVPAYTTGVKDISGGVIIEKDKTEFSVTVDGVTYEYNFPLGNYSSQDFLDMFNTMLKNGDKNGKTAPVQAFLEDGHLKLSFASLGVHSITNISGSAKGSVFYEERGRIDENTDLMLQIGANSRDNMALEKLRLSTVSLKINAIGVSKAKYAQKALSRIDKALDYVNLNRSDYGAKFNRLEYTSNGNENTAENLQRTESLIRDANMAYEMIQQSKASILVQTNESIMAQANESVGRVLSLLR